MNSDKNSVSTCKKYTEHFFEYVTDIVQKTFWNLAL